MKRLLFLIVLLSCTSILGLSLKPPSADEAGARQAVEHYFRGHATGDGENFKKAFHPEAKLFWVRDGQLAQRTSTEYIAGASGKPAADEAERKRLIESIDISGNAAMAKVVLDYPHVRFVDYLSLLKIGDEWKIINKTFYAQPKK